MNGTLTKGAMNGHNGHGPPAQLTNGNHDLGPRLITTAETNGYRTDLMIERPISDKHRPPLIPTKNYMELGLFMA